MFCVSPCQLATSMGFRVKPHPGGEPCTHYFTAMSFFAHSLSQERGSFRVSFRLVEASCAGRGQGVLAWYAPPL